MFNFLKIGSKFSKNIKNKFPKISSVYIRNF